MANNMDTNTFAIAGGVNTPRSASRSIRVPAGARGGLAASASGDGLTLVHVLDEGPSLSARAEASAQRRPPSDERPPGAGGGQMEVYVGDNDDDPGYDDGKTVTDVVFEASAAAASQAASATGNILVSGSMASLGAATGAVVGSQIAKTACEQIPIIGGLVSPLAQRLRTKQPWAPWTRRMRCGRHGRCD